MGWDLTTSLEMFRLPAFKTQADEDRFWARDDQSKLSFRTFFLGLAILTFAAIGLLDALAGGAAASLLLEVRTVTVLIMAFILYKFRQECSPKRRDMLIALFGMTAGLSITTMTLIAPQPAADYYPFLLSATMVFGGALIAPRSSTLLVVCIAVNAIYWPTTPFAATSDPALYANMFVMSVTTFSVVVGAFTREKLEREQATYETDLTSEREKALALRDEAIRANQAKSHLLANVSHELRTPMNAILGFSDVMKQELFGPMPQAKYREYVGDIHAAGTLLQTSINDLLDLSRLEVGKMSWVDAWVPLAKLMDRAINTCAADAEDADISLVRKLDDEATLMRCDPDRMAQILINVVTNAIKFSDAKTSVIVQCESRTGHTIIRVTDRGCGIPPEDLERIVEPFGQVDGHSTTARKSGLGLGLSIVRGLVEKFEGELLIDSEIGAGTTVSIMIPAERIARRPRYRSGCSLVHSVTA